MGHAHDRKSRCKIVCLIGLALTVALTSILASAEQDAPASGARDVFHRLDHRGDQREYILHLPPAAAHGQVGLIVALHGVTPSIESFRRQTGLDAAADREGFAVLYPLGIRRLGLLTWNAGACCGWAAWHGVDDVGFILRSLDDALAGAPIDPSRVYLTGLSNGAMMAYRLSATAPDRFAALAAVAGTLGVIPRPDSPALPILHIQSIDDPLLPYGGRRTLFGRFPGVEEMLQPWLALAGCPTRPQVSRHLEHRGEPGYEGVAIRKSWAPCRGDVQIIAWQLIGPGHVWPGGQPPPALHWLTHGPTRLIDANVEIWRFFSRYRLPHSPHTATIARPPQTN